MSRILILSVFSFLSIHGFAQLLVGPVVGAGFSKMYYFDSDPATRYQSVPSFGFDGGFMAQMKMKKNFTLNAQILYAYKTRTINGVDASRRDNEFKLTSAMNYIEMPIYYALEFKRLTGDLTGQGGQTKTYNWFIGAGPVISYWMSERGTLKSSNLKELRIDQLDYTTRFGFPDSLINASTTPVDVKSVQSPNRFQWGINITTGVSFEPAGMNKIIASVQLTLAQTFLATSNGQFQLVSDDIDVLKAKNHSLRFSVAYLLDTKLDKRKKGKSTSKIPKKKRR